jgi:phosphatidyl-myo-inositol alpha-mannosyltransferase
VRIGLVCPYDLGSFGGVQDLVTGLAGWLADAGHVAWVVGPGEGGARTVGIGRSLVVPVNGSAAPIALGPGVGSRVRAALEGADVVHIHEPFVPAVGVAATRIADAALVGTFHADPSRVIRRVYRAAAPLLRRTVRRLDVVTAVSPVAASALAPFARPRLVPNGVDTADFDPQVGMPNRVAFLGRDDPRKGLDVLLAAWPIVRRRVPDAELVVAAGGRTGTMAGVRFVGGVGAAGRRELLAGASVYCAPNLGGESFGIVLVQAMASRCAIVASALPAFTHVVGDAGLLVKPGDATGLAAALVTVLGDDERRASLQSAALERVSRFDRQAVVAGYLDAYRDAMERFAGRADG